MEPLISIVIPLYNKEDQIKSTIESILLQSYKNFEIIVVNDGSTDNSLREVLKFSINNIRVINQSNGGVSSARNRGIIEANGDFISFLDADDNWKANYLQEQVNAINKYPECGIYATGYEYINEYGNISPVKIKNIRFKSEIGLLDNYFEVAATSVPPIWTSAVIIRKSCLQENGGFLLGVATGEDLLLWAQLSTRYKIAYTKAPLAQYYLPSNGTMRKDPNDMSLRNDIVMKRLIELYKQVKPVDMNLYLSFWCKMRAVININKGCRVEALRYSINSLYWNIKNYKAFALVLLSLLPFNPIKFKMR